MPRRLILLSILLALLPLYPTAAAAAPRVTELTLGMSREGRPITAVRIGDGPRKLVVAGGTHGFPEANTFELATLLADHYRSHPEEVPASIRLYIVPQVNPDGYALQTRQNAAGVDLNRNMNTDLDSCPENDWRTTVFGAYGVLSDTGGPYADSEPESQIVRDLLLDASGVIFLHSNAGSVFPAFCEYTPSLKMAQVYAAAAGYQYARYWTNYQITGGMHDWASSLGIAAVIPELISGDQPEFAQNLAGLRAVFAQAETLLPLPETKTIDGIAVPPTIWRFWRAHGGEERFGRPLAPATRTEQVVSQVFERAILTQHEQLADTPQLVQVAPIGRTAAAATGRDFPEAPPDAAGRTFPETRHSVRDAFLAYWERYGGLTTFGYPISEEFTGATLDGKQRAMQYFERAIFVYDEAQNIVRLEPLGWATLVRERSLGTDQHVQAR